MRRFALALSAVLTLSPVLAAPLHHTPPSKPAMATMPVGALTAPAVVCLNPKKDYDADYVTGRTVLIKAKVGKRPLPKLSAETNCIGIDGGVRIKVQAKDKCLAVGDVVKLRRPGDGGIQTCQITQLTPAP